MGEGGGECGKRERKVRDRNKGMEMRNMGSGNKRREVGQKAG